MAAPSRGRPHPSRRLIPRAALAGDLAGALTALDGVPPDAASTWVRGWILLAMGRSGEALLALDQAEERAHGDDPATVAAACATRAALLRQVALHDRATADDERGLDLLGAHRAPAVEAGLRIGLVADAVGRGAPADELRRRLGGAAAAVARARDLRQSIRLGWVRGEVALVAGVPRQADEAFAGAASLAHRLGWRRHEAKALLFLAATAAAERRHDDAHDLARRGRALAAACGATPLLWPADLLLAEVTADPAAQHQHLRTARRTLAQIVDALPTPLRDEARTRPPASWLLTGEEPTTAGDARST